MAEWRAAASADLLAIIDYIAEDNPDAAQALKDEIENRVAALDAHPRLYRVGRVPGTREMVVRHGYIVIYAEPAGPRGAGPTVILRVLHGARLWPPG